MNKYVWRIHSIIAPPGPLPFIFQSIFEGLYWIIFTAKIEVAIFRNVDWVTE